MSILSLDGIPIGIVGQGVYLIEGVDGVRGVIFLEPIGVGVMFVGVVFFRNELVEGIIRIGEKFCLFFARENVPYGIEL